MKVIEELRECILCMRGLESLIKANMSQEEVEYFKSHARDCKAHLQSILKEIRFAEMERDLVGSRR